MSGGTTRPAAAGIREAIERAVAAIRADPRDPRGWSALGAAYFTLGQFGDAEQALRRARALDAHDLESGLRHAAALLELGRARDAIDVAEVIAAAHPSSADAHFVAGNAHAALGEQSEAEAAFGRAAALGGQATGHAGDAEAAGLRTTALAHYNRALALDELGRWDEAARACEAALACDATLSPALAQLVFLERRLCDWRELDARSAQLIEAVRDERDGITPFSFLAEPASAAEQLRCATTWARSIASRVAGAPVGAASAPMLSTASARPGYAAETPPTVTPARAARVRIGFVSSGFNNHPTALLIVELIEKLRDSGLETVGFATTASDGGALRERISRAFHAFVELDRDDHASMAQRIRDARIDVLFDLRGYGGGSVSEVFAMRPCARQVNWLAYPGTSGAPFIDVLVADPFVVPRNAEHHYSEHVVRMPHAFQPSDTTREVAAAPGRIACGLPASGTVFASFNNSYKISPPTFACWMRILDAVPGSVLWLLAGRDEEAATRNLRASAASAGLDTARLVFMRKLPHLEYLARYAHVDLFLDTWPYNAHTTASDALYAGCPVLTLPGETFASRVAGSLVTTLGLDALVAHDPDDYVSRALALVRDPRAMRARVAAAKLESPLFDMHRFASDFAALVRGL